VDAHDRQTDIDLQILDLLREESPKSAYRLAGELTRSGEEAVGTHAVRKRLEALASRGLVAGSASAHPAAAVDQAEAPALADPWRITEEGLSLVEPEAGVASAPYDREVGGEEEEACPRGGPVRDYEAPLLGELLQAALDEAHLKVRYDSIGSGVTERVIFPYGLYASQGYWYCACFDRRRQTNVPMRADRFLSAERVEGFESPRGISLQGWMNNARRMVGEWVWMRARVTERGRKSFELTTLFGSIAPEEGGGGILEAEIPHSEIDYYASRLLSVGTDVMVEYPQELVEAIESKA